MPQRPEAAYAGQYPGRIMSSVKVLGENDTSTVVPAVAKALEMRSLQKDGRLHIRELFYRETEGARRSCVLTRWQKPGRATIPAGCKRV